MNCSQLEMRGVRKLAGEKNTFAIYEVTTPEAGAVLFRGTNWCVKDPRYFLHYKPNRYYMLVKEGERYGLYHPESGQLKVVSDAAMSLKQAYPFAEVLQQAGLLPDRKAALMAMIKSNEKGVNRVLATVSAVLNFPEELGELILPDKKKANGGRAMSSSKVDQAVSVILNGGTSTDPRTMSAIEASLEDGGRGIAHVFSHNTNCSFRHSKRI